MTQIANRERGVSVRAKLNTVVGTQQLTRAAFVSDVAGGYSPSVGTVVFADGLAYKKKSGSTAISDLTGWVPAGDVFVEHFGAVGDNVADDSAAFQAAVDYVGEKADPFTGGDVFMASAEYQAAGIVMSSFVVLQGEGLTASVIRVPNGANAHCITIPKSSIGVVLKDFGVDGNSAQQTGNWDDVHVEDATGATGGGLHSLDKSQATGVESFAFRQLHLSRLYLRGASGHGLYIGDVNYGCFGEVLYIVRNTLDGFRAYCTDSIFSTLYIGHNGENGLNVQSGANKFSNVKSIWNGRTDGTKAGIVNGGGRQNIYVNCETQDNYCDGWQLTGQFQALNATSSNDGRKSLAEPELSSGTNAGFRFTGQCNGAQFVGMQHSFQGLDLEGNYTTEWPYVCDSDFNPELFSFSSDGKYNSRPPSYERRFLTNSDIGTIRVRSDDNSLVNFDISPISPDASGDEVIRLFRQSTGGANANLDVFVPGTSTVNNRLGNGNTVLNGQSGDAIIGNGAWDGQRMRLGPWYFWVDGTGALRKKNAAPTSDTDGSLV